MNNLSLIWFICPTISLKEIRTGISYLVLMLHQDLKSPGPLRLKNRARLHLYCKQSVRNVTRSNIPRPSKLITVLSSRARCRSCLKNIMLIFEEQQQNTSILIRLSWKLLTKSWRICCLNQWMPKTSRSLKKYLKFGSKI